MSSLQLSSSLTRCKSSYPDTSPIILGLSIYSSVQGAYTVVYVTGYNFQIGGTTTVSFGTYQNISVTFYSSMNISFVIPTKAIAGTYIVQVFNNVYPTSLYSNTVNYNVT
jgi:hypothetical protein